MKKNILFVNGHMNIGGVEKSLLDILNHIDYENYNVDLLLFESIGDYEKEIPSEVNIIFKDLKDTYGNIFHSILTCVKNKNIFCLKARILFLMTKYLNKKILYFFKFGLNVRKKYDHAIAFRTGICADVVAYSITAIKKSVWWHHGVIQFDEMGKVNFINLCKQIDNVVAVSEPFTNELKNTFPSIENKFMTISNMIDESSIIEKSKLFNPYVDINEDKRILVSVGRLSPEKEMKNIVYAAQGLIEKNFDNFIWYVVGDGVEFNSLEKLINENKLNNYIKLVGAKTNPYPYIENANYFIHTSYVESQGIVILEAMLLGCPCVVAKSKGALTLINSNENGILVEQNVDDLVNGIIEMDSSNIDLFIENAKNTVSEYFSYNIMRKINNLL